MTPARDLTFPQAVEDARDMFGRVKEIEKIRAALRSRARRTVVILGGRLIGKTSLLNVVTQWAGRRAAFTIVKVAHAGSREEFMAEILHGLEEVNGAAGTVAAASAGGSWRGAVGVESFEPHPGSGPITVARFVRLVQERTDRSPRSRFLLCVDEFDSLLRGCTDDGSRQILDLILHLTEHTSLPIRFLFTMSQVPDQVRLSYSSPFLNQAAIVELGPWSAAESREFVEWIVGDPSAVDGPVHQEIYRAAGGHPYFTKAVLKALREAHQPDAPHERIAASSVRAAVEAAVRSREVAVALSNLADVHLTGQATQVLDRAGASPDGIGLRGLRDLAPVDRVLGRLIEGGLLEDTGGRYVLRLGLWRQWRAAQIDRGGRRHGAFGRTWRRWVGVGARRSVLITALSVLTTLLLGVLLVGAVVFLPSSAVTAGSCSGSAAGLRVRAAYPRYVALGDDEKIELSLVNAGSGPLAVTGGVLVAFPTSWPGRVRTLDTNQFPIDVLDPGQERAVSVPFVYDQPGRLMPDSASSVPVELRITVAGSSCPRTGWSMEVAPVPHLRGLRNAVIGLLGLVFIPLLIEWFVGRGGGHRAGRRPLPGPGPGGRSG